MSETHPRGWTVRSSADLFEFVTSGSRGWAQYYADNGPLFVRIGNLDHDTISLDLRHQQFVRPPASSEGERTRLRSGDILISITAELGMVGLVPDGLGEAYINQHIALARPRAGLDPRYLAWFFASSGKRQLLEMRRGVTKAGLGLDDIRRVSVGVPPLNEQRRIVAKLEALQSRSRRAREALDALPPLLEKLRQSLLAAAFRGDLTKDWRAKHKDVEPATELLKRIRIERRKKWEEAELAKMTAKGKRPTDDKWKAKYKEPAPVDTTGLPELPQGWCWASVDQLVLRIDAGRSPKAHGRPASADEKGVLKVSAVSWEEFDPAENKALLEGEEIGDTPTVGAGDLLISRANTAQLVGAVVLVQNDHPNLMLSDKTLRLVPASATIPLELLLHALRTREVRAVFEADATGTSESMRNLSQDKIRAAPIALPPAAEAAVVARLLSVTTRARRSMDRERGALVSTLAELDRAILAKAFRGELVPQDLGDASLGRHDAEIQSTGEHGTSRRTPGGPHAQAEEVR